MRLPILGCSLALLLCPACDAPELDAGETQTPAFRPSTGGGGTGGMYLNTNTIGADAFSALDTTGAVHDGVRLKKVEIKDGGKFVKLDQVWAEDGELVGNKGATVYRGSKFLNSRWSLSFQKGVLPEVKQTMWVTGYTATGSEHSYTFHHGAKKGTPTPVCADDGAGAVTSRVFNDLTVDPITGDMTPRAHTLYFGCVSGAVGKAATWGYTPWELGLADFEAAVRVVRADYCGDGTSWTQVGTEIQLSDVWDVNDFVDLTAPSEAIWDEHGALCIVAPRLDLISAGSVTCNGQPIPFCDDSADLTTFEDALFWTRPTSE